MPLLASWRIRILISATMLIITLRDAFVFRRLARKRKLPFNGHPGPFPLSIPSQNRILEAAFQPSHSAPAAAILILHGIGDQLHYWEQVQFMLRRHHIASLIFHYSGYGQSTGSITPQNLRADACSAYAYLQILVPPGTPIFALGFSLGTAILVDAAPAFTPVPAGIILCQAFTTVREAAAEITHSTVLSRLLPDIWRTVEGVRSLSCPLHIVHSDGDELFPTHMARALSRAACDQNAHAVSLAKPFGFSHNHVYLRPTPDYWDSILCFIDKNRTRTDHPHSDDPV